MRSSLLIALLGLVTFCAYSKELPVPDDVSRLKLECTEAFSHADHSQRAAVLLWCPPSLRYLGSPDHAPIPSEWWPESVQRLRPVFVYTEDHGAVVIVQSLTGIQERGIYVHLRFSSQFSKFEKRNPPWRYRDLGNGVYQYEREPKA